MNGSLFFHNFFTIVYYNFVVVPNIFFTRVLSQFMVQLITKCLLKYLVRKIDIVELLTWGCASYSWVCLISE